MTINSTQTPSRNSYLLNKVGLFDEYISYKENEYTDSILVGDFDGDKFTGTKYSVTQERSGYNSVYNTSQTSLTEETVTIANEYYVYSNIGIGQQAQIYSHQQLLSGSIVILLGVVIGYMIFKGLGGVWQWLRSGR